MGRELTDIHMNKKQNHSGNSNGSFDDTVHVAPRKSVDSIETTDYEVKECTIEASLVEKLPENEDVPSVTEGKTTQAGAQRSPVIDKKNSPSSKIAAVGYARVKCTVPHPFSLATEKRSPCVTPGGAEMGNCGVVCSRIANTLRSPNANTLRSPNAIKSPQSHSPLFTRKLWQVDNKKHLDEEDNWSLASSAAASVRTRITVGSAPTFRSSERAERRKEYYMKLEEKHQALAAEKSQCEARTKEEQEAAIKQMRKNMVVRANPVPSFYQEGPPPKVELRKVPLTRPKSPNLTRRKSSSDAINSCQKDAGSACSRACRHSIGAFKLDSPLASTNKIKAQINGQNGDNRGLKVRV